MKKSLAAMFACAVLLGSGAAVVPASAHGHHHGCVSRSEYRHVHKGMTRHHVRHIFDTAGKRKAISHSGAGTSEIRRYAACHRRHAVLISFTAYFGNAPLRLNNKVRSR
jgi:hypothetical protein